MDQLQFDIHTSPNRYPFLFKRLQSYSLADSSELKILSFGCSVGAELHDLHRAFPKAKLFGCDVSPSALAEAKERCSSFADVFFSSDAEIAARGPFHLVLCLSVLCIHGSHAERIGELLPFSKFEDVLLKLSSHVANDGAIAIFNASYFPQETRLIDHFRAVPTPGVPENSHIKRYNRSGKLVVEHSTIAERGIQRMVADWGAIPDSYLIDCLFERAGPSRFRVDLPSKFTIESEWSQCFYKEIDLESRYLYRGRIERLVRTDDGRRITIGQNHRRSTSGNDFIMLGNYIHEAVSGPRP